MEQQQQQFLLQRIEALEKENLRLNKELIKIKDVALKVRLSDPDFDKKLSELTINYEVI